MGYKKTIQRNEISGLFEHNDIPDGEHSVNELRARADARAAALADAHRKDWSDPNTVNSPAYGNSMSRQPRPSDAVVGSKSERFGSGTEDDTDSSIGGQPQKPSKQKGIEPARKRA